MSARRTASDLREFASRGLIDKALHYNSVLNALENPDLTPILKAMIEESAAPLRALETDFAADSSGFSTNTYARWFDAKYGREMSRNLWFKAHVMIGTRTNIVTSVEVTESSVHDSPMLPALLNTSAKRFTMERASADKGYLSNANVAAIDAHGAEPFIPFKSNSREGRIKGRNNSELWHKCSTATAIARTSFCATITGAQMWRPQMIKANSVAVSALKQRSRRSTKSSARFCVTTYAYSFNQPTSSASKRRSGRRVRKKPRAIRAGNRADWPSRPRIRGAWGTRFTTVIIFTFCVIANTFLTGVSTSFIWTRRLNLRKTTTCFFPNRMARGHGHKFAPSRTLGNGTWNRPRLARRLSSSADKSLAPCKPLERY